MSVKKIGKIKDIINCYCTHCKTVYEVDANQVGYVSYTDYSGSTEQIHGFHCLDCGNIVEVKNIVPKDSIIE